MYSLLELLPKEMVEKLKNLEVKELSSYVRYLKEVIKERVTILHHYKNQNLEILSDITSYPSQVGLFWCGRVFNNKTFECKDFIIYSCWSKDIFLLPTLVFESQEDLEKWLKENSYKYESEFLYRDGQVFFYENFLPLCDKNHNSFFLFYKKLYPLL